MLYLFRLLMLAFWTLLMTPFLALIAATLLFFNLVQRVTRLARPASPTDGGAAPSSGLVSIVILNWNGRDLLAESLPSVLAAVEADGRPHEIIVVDNGSTDASVEYVAGRFPGVRIIRLEENLGFGEGNNIGVRAAVNEIVVLLNNDMVVDRAFLRPLIEGFGPKTFAVTSQIFMQDQSRAREESGRTAGIFRRGMIEFTHRPFDARQSRRRYYPALWAGGGSSAIHRGRFLSLGGFDEIYSPVYVEDTDLSYRAWKAGWEVLFAPASIVHHKHRASSARRFTSRQLQIQILRNQFLFLWRNIGSFRLMLAHCAFLPWNCYRLSRDCGVSIWLALFQAAGRMPLVEVKKLGAPSRSVRSDQEIFALFSRPGTYRAGQAGGEERRAAARDARPRILWLTAYLPHLGRHAGAGRMCQLLRRIAPHYRVTLLSFLETEEEREFVPEIEGFCERVVALRRAPPLRWQLFPYEPFDEFRTPEMEAALAGCLEEDDFVLMQLEYTQMACYAGKDLPIPALLTKHEVDFAACARRAGFEKGVFGKLRWFYNYLQVLDREIRLTRRVAAAICMTEPDGRELRKFCSSVPVHVINTGVDLEYFRPPEQPAAEPRLVFVGAFQHHPNVDAMLHFCNAVFPRIRAVVPGAELIIAGSNPPPGVAALAQVPGVTVTGFVPDIRPYMASSSVYIVPLRLGVGIRGKVLEAWSMAMAVVATPVACAGLRYEHGRNLLVAGSDESFAEQVIALLKDPEKRRRLGAEGRRIAEEFYGWDTAARQLLELYERYGRQARAAVASAAGSCSRATELVGVHNPRNESGGAVR